jgi:hypothetical protein
MQAMSTNATTLSNPLLSRQQWKTIITFALVFLLCVVVFIEPAFAQATGTGTGTGAGGAGAAQTRIVNVATGWQNIVQGIGVVVLIIAWSIIGYMIAFNGKTMKDMMNPMIGSTIAGLAPVLVSWLFS